MEDEDGSGVIQGTVGSAGEPPLGSLCVEVLDGPPFPDRDTLVESRADETGVPIRRVALAYDTHITDWVFDNVEFSQWMKIRVGRNRDLFTYKAYAECDYEYAHNGWFGIRDHSLHSAWRGMEALSSALGIYLEARKSWKWEERMSEEIESADVALIDETKLDYL